MILYRKISQLKVIGLIFLIGLTSNSIFNDADISQVYNVNQLINSTNFAIKKIVSNQLTIHDPIEIICNENFTDYALPGSGTENDPFIIERLNITTSENVGIYIGDVSVFFVIQQCYVNASEVGIQIISVIGNAQIIDNVCLENNYGIEVIYSSNSTIANNLCVYNDEVGIKIEGCSNSSIANNTCTDNKVGIRFERGSDSLIDNNICFNSDTYGIHLLTYYKSNIRITNNLCSSNAIGFYAEAVFHVLIAHNTFSYNHNGSKMFIRHSVIINNNCSQNFNYGMFLSDSSGNTLTYNHFIKNINHGLYIGNNAEANRIHHNNFIGNNEGEIQAFDEEKFFLYRDNVWFDKSSREGNYWDNFQGKGSYEIEGRAKSKDRFPLNEPAVFEGNIPPIPVTPEFNLQILLLLFPFLFSVFIILKKRKRKKEKE